MVILQHSLPVPVSDRLTPSSNPSTVLSNMDKAAVWGRKQHCAPAACSGAEGCPPPPPLPSPSPQARRSVFQWSKLVAPSKTVSPLHVVQEQRTAATLARSPPNACADRPWRVLNLVLATSHYLCGTGKNYPMQYNADQTMQNMSHLYRMWNSTSLSAEYKLPAEL